MLEGSLPHFSRVRKLSHATGSYAAWRRVRGAFVWLSGFVHLPCAAKGALAPCTVDRAWHGSALWPHVGNAHHLAIARLPVWPFPHYVWSRAPGHCCRLGHHPVQCHGVCRSPCPPDL